MVLGVGAISGVQWLKYRYSDKYKLEREVRKVIDEYNNDPYGGDTPEETMRLFLDALKKGDLDLASKYFVMEKWEEISKEFHGLNKEQISRTIDELQKTKLKKYENDAFFVYYENNKAVSDLVMIKHPVNNRWKISEL